MLHEEELPSVFRDLHISVFSKAFSISSNSAAGDVTTVQKLDDQTKTTNKGKGLERKTDSPVESTELNDISCINFSTPRPKKQNNTVLNASEKANSSLNTATFVKCNLSPILDRKLIHDNTFSAQKLLHLCDLKRCLTVEKVMTERIQNMHETNKMIHDSLEHLKQARLEETNTKWLLLEQKILDDVHEQEIRNRPKREAQLAEDNLKNAQRVLERNQRMKDAENEAKRKAEAIQLNRKLRDKILSCQSDYAQIYKEIISLINTCENKNVLMESSLMKDLKNHSAECKRLLKKGKTNDITEEDVNCFVKLVELVKDIQKNIVNEIERINAEAKKVQDAQLKETVQENKTVAAENKKEQADLSDCFDSQSLQNYMNLKNYLESFDTNCKSLIEDVSLKKFRFNCQKAVTTPLNAICSVSSAHLTDKYMRLFNLLSGKVVEVGGVQVSAAQHPSGIAYCKKLLAKKFVRQGDMTVSSKPDSAFSIAAVLVSLWVDFPDFGQLTLAYFQQSCPYLAPVFLPQVEGQSIEDYHKSLGYHYTENGEVEKQDSFLKRMSGIMRLYAALLVSKVRHPDKSNPLGISEGWRWLSAILNLEPRSDICATLIFDFLEVAGNEMFRVYGAQFKKQLAYICQVYYPKLEKVTPSSSGGPIVRLAAFLQKIMKSESIPPPNGLLPPNFW